MKIIRFTFLLSMFFSISSLIFAQEITVNGKVRDKNTYAGIPSVNIFVKGRQIGTVSDFSGKFFLKILKPNPDMIIVFQHVAYDVLEVPLDSAKTLHNIYLQPRVIHLKGLTIEALGMTPEIKKDLPQSISVAKSRDFQTRGFTDAGDFLSTDHSVQIDERMSGKKTIAIRGGNPDEVLVVYNGIRINNSFDNVFDLSLIDLQDLDRLEIIKGSSTVLYGPGALSGIVSIVPKVYSDYNIRFQQRIGTYRSGNWGLHLYKDIDRLHVMYSFTKGATKRVFSNTINTNEFLQNRASHHTASLVYNFSENRDKNSLTVMYLRSSLDYNNNRDMENLSDLNRVVLLKYKGDIGFLRNLDFSGSYHQLEEKQGFSAVSQSFSKKIYDDVFSFNAEKCIILKRMEFLLGYQFENSKLKFRQYSTFATHGIDIQFNQIHKGFFAISKYHAPSGYDFISSMDFDLSIRHDIVKNEQNNQEMSFGTETSQESLVFPPSQIHLWNETVVKFSANLNGNRGDLTFNGYMNFGTNIKFPNLFQQISIPFITAPILTHSNVNPEKDSGTELGIEITKDVQGHPVIYGWEFSGNFFKNYYDNKFTYFYTPGVPLAYFDNVRDANMTGLETKSGVFLFRKKVTIEIGVSRYFISNKAAFPFKSDAKATLNLRINHAGYGLQLHLFKESEQVGWIRQYPLGFVEVGLPGQTNLDFYLSKTFEFGKLKLMGNAAGRNLLNRTVELSGLTIRDRRFYLTVGIQY